MISLTLHSILTGDWARIGAFSGIQQFIANFVYAIMIVKMVNMVAEQGNYWVANNFVWGWLLIPIYAITEVIRKDCKEGYICQNDENPDTSVPSDESSTKNYYVQIF